VNSSSKVGEGIESMSKNTIKLRAKVSEGVATVRVLISHPMETGQRKDKKTGKLIPAKYIQEVVCEHKGAQVLVSNWGPAVSKDPYLSFKIRGASKGDKLKVSWLDNEGQADALETQI
jgi:sulfur-oxidizing protein SoxZ